MAKQECKWEHRWSWNGQAWVCEDCGKVAVSQNALIEPCLSCGADADADDAYCENCAG